MFIELSPRRKRAWQGLNSKGLTRKIPTPVVAGGTLPNTLSDDLETPNFKSN
jgi:hypothetical protein